MNEYVSEGVLYVRLAVAEHFHYHMLCHASQIGVA